MIYLDPLRDLQEEAPAAACERCRGEVYSGETMYLWEGEWLCSDCFKAAVEAMLEGCPSQVALEMGLDTKEV